MTNILTMRTVGSICWILEALLVLWFLYEGRDRVTTRSLTLKGLSSTMPVVYAGFLIHMFGRISTGSTLFLFALLLNLLGDVITGYLAYIQGGSISSAFKSAGDAGGSFYVMILMGGSAFIASYFFEMIVFLRRIDEAGALQQYILLFLLLFLIPLIIAIITGVATSMRLPEISTQFFIIGVFYLIVTSALFASTVVFGAWFTPYDLRHAVFISLGGVTFLLSAILVGMRYLLPRQFDNRPIRYTSRSLHYLSYMILAGCAFLF